MTKPIDQRLTELPEDIQTEFYNSGYRFLKLISNTLGSDAENDVLESLSKVLGQDWADQLIIRKLDGSLSRIPEFMTLYVDKDKYQLFYNSASSSPAIPIIKSIRRISGSGLVDAKNVYDVAYQTGHSTIQISRFMSIPEEILSNPDLMNHRDIIISNIKECHLMIESMKQYGVKVDLL